MSFAKSYRDPAEPERAITIEQPFLDDTTYAQMVRTLPIPCTDIVFTVAGERVLYLSKRNVYPQKGVWVIGGRISFNDDTLEASAARCVLRETKIAIDASRFIFIATAFYSWLKIAQGDLGKNVAITYCCEITPEERGAISASLISSEYEPGFGLQAFTRERLLKEKCHPVLLDLFDTIFPTQ